MSPLHQTGSVGCFRRLLAAGCAVLVFALGLFAVNPILHEQLHHNDHSSSSDDGCAIVLFANGLAMPLAVSALPPPPAERSAQPASRLTEFVFTAPHYLLHPERGPPVG